MDRPALNRFQHWFELCRLPRVFTAAADSLAGALVVGAGWRDSFSVVALMLASGCLYAGGHVLNDWHDFKVDMARHPLRPLPRKQIHRVRALLLAVLLLVSGGIAASIPGCSSGQVGAILIGVIIFYDILLKGVPIAPAALSLCRALNLLMGMMLVPVDESAVGWSMRISLAAMLGLYVFGLTLFARRDNLSDSRMLWAGCVITWLAALAVGLLGLLFHKQAQHHTMGFLWLALLLAIIGYRMSQAVLTPEYSKIRLAVATATYGIIFFDAALVAWVRGFLCSVPVVLLLVPALWLERYMRLERLKPPVVTGTHVSE